MKDYGNMSDENNFPLPHVPKFPGLLFDGFGQPADERVHVYAIVHAAAAQAAEREWCATECERLAAEARAEMRKQPEGSPARDRYFARNEALRTAAVELRLGPHRAALLGDAAAEREHMAELEARIVELTAERELLRGEVAMLRETMEGAAYQLSTARIWGGMELHFNTLQPLHYKPALDRLREVLDRA
jgi:hypothetical protein